MQVVAINKCPFREELKYWKDTAFMFVDCGQKYIMFSINLVLSIFS